MIIPQAYCAGTKSSVRQTERAGSGKTFPDVVQVFFNNKFIYTYHYVKFRMNISQKKELLLFFTLQEEKKRRSCGAIKRLYHTGFCIVFCKKPELLSPLSFY